jgi:hypothetical protein
VRRCAAVGSHADDRNDPATRAYVQDYDKIVNLPELEVKVNPRAFNRIVMVPHRTIDPRAVQDRIHELRAQRGVKKAV